MDDTGTVVAFWILAIITVGSALLTAAVRNLIHAVIFLIVSFMGVAGLYITLSADFIAVTQVLIYAGAISILLIFAIMLTPQPTASSQNPARDSGSTKRARPSARSPPEQSSNHNCREKWRNCTLS